MSQRALSQITFPAFFWMVLLLAASGHAQSPNDDHTLWTAKWSHDGLYFAIGGVDALWVFDAASLEMKSLLPERKSESGNAFYMAVTSIDWHPNSNLLAVSSQGSGRDANGIYDVASGNRVPLKMDYGRGVSWSPKGDMVATASTGDGHLRIWERDGMLMHDIGRYEEAKGLTGVSWRPTGDRIVTIGTRITLHDALGKPIKQVMHRPEAKERLNLLLSVEWHPSGEFFAVGDYGNEVDDPVIQFWSADGELQKSIILQGESEVRNLSWNHDGSLLASASEKLRIWNREGELKFAGKSPDLLWGVDWHPAGDKILTSSIDGRITLWSSTAKVLREIMPPASSQPHAEPDRAAKGSQSSRSVTNHSSSLTGPRR